MRHDVEMVGRFEATTLPDGSRIFLDPEPHRYYGHVKPSKTAEGGYSFTRESALPGASSVAKALDEDPEALMHWAVKRGHEGIARLVSEDIERGASVDWLTDPLTISARLAEHNLRWTDVRDQMAEWGTNVHRHVVLELAHGRVPSLADRSEEERGFAQAELSWWRERQPSVIAAEQATASLDKGYAGQFDLLFEVDVDRLDPDPEKRPPAKLLEGRESIRVLKDAKTRTNGKDRRADHTQVELYEVANRDCGIGPSDVRLVLLLMPDGNFREVWSTATDADAYAALVAFQRGKELGKRIDKGQRARKAVPA